MHVASMTFFHYFFFFQKCPEGRDHRHDCGHRVGRGARRLCGAAAPLCAGHRALVLRRR